MTASCTTPPPTPDRSGLWWNSDDLAVGATIESLSVEADRNHLDDPLMNHQVTFDSTPNVGVEVTKAGGRDRANDNGTIAIRLLVDDQFDEVIADLGSTDQIDALDRAIASLHRIRTELETLYGQRPRRRGQCLAIGEHGQCVSPVDHDGSHHFVTTMTLIPARSAQEAGR